MAEVRRATSVGVWERGRGVSEGSRAYSSSETHVIHMTHDLRAT